MRILLLCDHRWRDVPALAAIKIELRKLGLPARVISFDLHQEAVDLYKPHIVILNHLHGSRNQRIADTVKRRGGLCFVLPTEGRPSTAGQLEWAAEAWPPRLCNLYLCWTETFRKMLPKEVASVVAGCPRFDFYSEPFSVLCDDRELLCAKYGLDSSRPILTVASSFPQAKFATHARQFHVQDWKDLRVTEVEGFESPLDVAEAEQSYLNAFRNWLRMLDGHQIIIKPHPAEDVKPWRQLADEIGAALMLCDYGHNLLAVSGVHLARAECLTLVEALLTETPTVTAMLRPERPGPGQEALAHSTKVASGARLSAAIAKAAVSPKASEYVDKWLGPTPGASQRVAEAIAERLQGQNLKLHAEPNRDDLARLHSLMAAHDRQRSGQLVDGIGQFSKAVLHYEVREWERRIARCKP